jgi:uncharacterized iron-regulated membrane protein
MSYRKFHRRAALLLCPFLLLSTVTGLTYRLGRSWCGMSKDTGLIVRGLHEGAFLGTSAVPFYVLLLGLGTLVLIATGLTMIPRKASAAGNSPRQSNRRLHRILAVIFSLPLVVTAVAGMAFRLTQSWLGWSKEQAQILMDIHQGSYLGPELRPYYVLIIGLGILGLLATGISLSGLFRKRRRVES